MRDPKQTELVNSVFQGITRAQEDYRDAFMSSIWSSYAPEYLMTISIFQSILQLLKNCDRPYGLSLEEPVFGLIESLGGKSGNGFREGKCDLSLRDVNDQPLAVIEVKKDAWEYWDNFGRLRKLVKAGLKLGIFASCLYEKVTDKDQKEAETKLDEHITYLYKYVMNDVGALKSNLSIRKPSVLSRLVLSENAKQKEEWCWCPICFVMT